MKIAFLAGMMTFALLFILEGGAFYYWLFAVSFISYLGWSQWKEEA